MTHIVLDLCITIAAELSLLFKESSCSAKSVYYIAPVLSLIFKEYFVGDS